jgi:guanyl-specific ribonuclease Sa
MLKLPTRLAGAVLATFLLAGGAAYAQTPATATPPAATTTTAPKMAAPAMKKSAAPRTAASLECSKQADAKAVHGKERKKLMSSCKKGGGTKTM